MTGQENHTEIELERGSVRIKVSGTEEFVKTVVTEEKWIGKIYHLLEKMTTLQIEKKPGKKVDKKSVTSEDSWIQIIANDVGVNTEFIEDTFQQDDDFAKVYDWPIEGSAAERRREVALLVMYINHLLHNTDEFSKKNITDVFDDLGLKYDHNLRSQLTQHVGIDSPKSNKFKINAQGRKAAKSLIKNQETRKSG